MADLTAKFTLVDEMSDRFASMAESGLNAVERWKQAGDAMGAAFDGIAAGTASAASSVDGVATSVAAAADSTNDWTEAVGNYDKSALEAIYTTEELVEMGFKTQEALDAERAAAEEAEKALDGLAQQSEDTGDAQEDMGKKGADAAETIASALAAAGITAVVKEIAESVYELVDAFSEAESTVVKATGASGEALDSLMESTMNAYAAAKSADLSTTASAIGEINTRMGLTGDALTTVTGQFLNFAEITGTDVVGSVQSATKIMNKWGVEAGDVESILDKLAYAGQVSGISVSSLADTVTNSSATFQALRMDLDNAISLLADLELYGTNSTTVVTGLRTAVNNFAGDGLDAEEALRDVIEQISNMEDASEATALAVETFGSRAGQELAGAIRSGAISVDSLTNSLDVAQGTLSSTADTAQTLEQKWTQASNNISTAFTSAVQPAVSGISSGLADIVNGLGDFLNEHPAVTKAITAIGVGIGVVVTGFALYTAGTAVATAATALFGTTLSAAIWPITAIAAAIAAVTAAVLFLVDAFQEDMGATEGMTAVTRAQYYELQDLNAEYEEACEKYGETSEEASRLRYQLEDLNVAFEANQQTVEEFTAEVDALCESVNSVSDSFNNSMSEINANEIGSLALIQKYEDLASKADLTAAEEKALEAVTKQLSASYPELAQRMESAAMSTEDYVEAMRKACEAEAEELRQQQAQETYIEALNKRAELAEEIAKAEENIRLEQERMDNMSGWTHFWTGGEWDDLNAYKDALEQLQATEAENEATIANIEHGWEVIAEAEAEAANATVSYEDVVGRAISSVQEDMDALCEAYDAAYERARSSIDGQIGLFDTMKTETELSVADMQTAFASQLEYLNTYTENLRKAAEYGLDEGLIASLSDGSEESAGYINAIINNIEALGGSSAEAQAFVDDFNASFREVEAAKDEFATTVATMETDFDEKMAEIEGRLDEAIDNMNMEADAAEAARETMDAYTQAIRDGTANAVSAAESAASAVAAALSTSYSGGTGGVAAAPAPTPVNKGATGWGMLENAVSLMADNSGVFTATAVEANAAGTTNAADAFIAGENGPELIIGKAGSTVFPADETDRIINAVTDNGSRVTSATTATGRANIATNAEEDFYAVGEEWPGTTTGKAVSAIPPAYETEQLINAVTTNNDNRLTSYTLSAPDAGGGNEGGSVGEQLKHIILEIAGGAPIEIIGGGGASEEEIVEILLANLRPALMSIVKEEIYEEGDGSYEH